MVVPSEANDRESRAGAVLAGDRLLQPTAPRLHSSIWEENLGLAGWRWVPLLDTSRDRGLPGVGRECRYICRTLWVEKAENQILFSKTVPG